MILEYLTKTDGKTETTRYTHGPGIDEPLAIERKGETYYYHADGLGSVVALTDSKQKVVESYTYDSFGELKRKGDKVKNTYAFTGREWDKEIKLYYYRTRYYDAHLGRFISKDPIGFVGGDVNLYNYVGGNAVNKIDPFGLRSKKYPKYPDLNPSQITPTPDTGELSYPYAPLSNPAQCPNCTPTFHPDVYWACVGNMALNQQLDAYLSAFALALVPSGASQAVGAGVAIAVSNYIGYTCHNIATYCDSK